MNVWHFATNFLITMFDFPLAIHTQTEVVFIHKTEFYSVNNSQQNWEFEHKSKKSKVSYKTTFFDKNYIQIIIL